MNNESIKAFQAIFANLTHYQYNPTDMGLGSDKILVGFDNKEVKVYLKSKTNKYAKFSISDNKVKCLTEDCTDMELMTWCMKKIIEQISEEYNISYIKKD